MTRMRTSKSHVNGEPGDPLEVPKLAPEETFTWWVSSIKSPDNSLFREGDSILTVAEMLKNRGVRRCACFH